MTDELPADLIVFTILKLCRGFSSEICDIFYSCLPIKAIIKGDIIEDLVKRDLEEYYGDGKDNG